jgi:hypothetical protein
MLRAYCQRVKLRVERQKGVPTAWSRKFKSAARLTAAMAQRRTWLRCAWQGMRAISSAQMRPTAKNCRKILVGP